MTETTGAGGPGGPHAGWGSQPAPGGGERPAAATPMAERMQALLARAVEDQLSEQRQLTGVLADVHERLARLPGEVKAAAGLEPDPRINALQAGVAGLTAELRLGLAEMREALGGLGELRSSVAEMREALAGLPAGLEQVDGRLGAVDRLVQQRGDDLADLRGRVGQVMESVTASERRVSEHVDEAVLALAEAMLRRRRPSARREGDEPPPGAAPWSAGAPAAASEPPPALAPSPGPPAAPDIGGRALGPGGPAAPQPPGTGPGPDAPPSYEPPPYQPPSYLPPEGAGGADTDSEEERRRRPWWRPGD